MNLLFFQNLIQGYYRILSFNLKIKNSYIKERIVENKLERKKYILFIFLN